MHLPLAWHKKRAKVDMPYVAEILLDLTNTNGTLTITDFINKAEAEKIGSRAHLFFNLTWLRTNGYVKADAMKDNKRTKEVCITPKGLRYLGIEQ